MASDFLLAVLVLAVMGLAGWVGWLSQAVRNGGVAMRRTYVEGTASFRGPGLAPMQVSPRVNSYGELEE